MARDPLPRLRKLCLALPEAHEKIAWGAPTFRVRNKLFAMFAAAGNHHGEGRAAAWINAAHDNQELLRVNDLLRDGYRRVAPKRLLAVLDET
jgi:hypothetical protein